MRICSGGEKAQKARAARAQSAKRKSFMYYYVVLLLFAPHLSNQRLPPARSRLVSFEVGMEERRGVRVRM